MSDDRSTPTAGARDGAISALQEHYARGHLDVREFETRVEAAENARTGTELARVTQGLPALVEAEARVPVAAVNAVLGSTSRRGAWRVPQHVRLRAVLGSLDVDLCDAELGPGETRMEVRALLGSITVVVPEGLAVECEGSALLGSFDHLAQGAASRRDGRVLRIRGAAHLGSVEIVVRPRTGLLQGIRALITGKG